MTYLTVIRFYLQLCGNLRGAWGWHIWGMDVYREKSSEIDLGEVVVELLRCDASENVYLMFFFDIAPYALPPLKMPLCSPFLHMGFM